MLVRVLNTCEIINDKILWPQAYVKSDLELYGKHAQNTRDSGSFPGVTIFVTFCASKVSNIYIF